MPELTYKSIKSHDPAIILPPDPEFALRYISAAADGMAIAGSKRAAFVAICRNAMPFLPFTLDRVERTANMFADWRCFIFENDSDDGTKEFLATVGDRYTVRSRDNGRPHLNFTKISERTVALAEYRNACRDWVRDNASDFDYVIVFDTDPWGGWSVDGVATTVSYLESHPEYANAAGMGSYSWCVFSPPVTPTSVVAHYDAWACRWNWWDERDEMRWFHCWHPPVGSPPVKMNSCFGQLALYRTKNYLAGQYRGGDCEHVSHWRTCGGDCYLNPSQRTVSFWNPDDDHESTNSNLHGHIHKDVAGRNADSGDRRDSADIG